MSSPSEIRRRMRNLRRSLDDREQQHRAGALVRQALRLPLFRRGRHVAFYLPNDGELDPGMLMTRARAMGIHCYLPVLSPTWHNRLWFAPYTPDTRLVLNSYRILEPAAPWREMRRPWALDLILAPLVAFDDAGNRLGMGGGFYDRSLAYLQRRNHWRKPRFIGLAHDFQRVPALNHNPWDVPLTGVITESGCYRFNEERHY